MMNFNEYDNCICPPVLVVGFNRPECLREVFDRVKEARPSELFLALDFPRVGRSDEKQYEECKKIFDGVDWPCTVHRNYSDSNMGCRDRMTSAITWAFETVDRLMIFEDDCVPDMTFFRFCSELLEKYKDDMRIGMIAGCDEHFHVGDLELNGDSYYFDRFASIWGWATWKRVWDIHDADISYWPEFRKRFHLMDGFFRNKRAVKNRMLYTDLLYQRKAGAWAGCWATHLYKENMLCIHPGVNLISNNGCGYSSRTDSRMKKRWWRPMKRNPWDRRPTKPMQFPLKHPVTMLPNIESEYWRFKDSEEVISPFKRLYRELRKFVRGIIFKMLTFFKELCR